MNKNFFKDQAQKSTISTFNLMFTEVQEAQIRKSWLIYLNIKKPQITQFRQRT